MKLDARQIDDVIRMYKIYQNKKMAQNMRGVNDFNVFTSLLQAHDEVRLHSRFIYSMLNPKGTHGQGSLFMEIFIRICGLECFDINVNECRVYKEYGGIDIYITDGNRHIIIENKIYAADQDSQIYRYIKTVEDENKSKGIEDEDIAIVYLSLTRDKPGNNSLGDLRVEDDSLIGDGRRYVFKTVTYENHMLEWIEKSHSDVENITNLAVAIKQYKDVVLHLYGKYRSKLMTLKSYIDRHESPGRLDKIKIIKSIATEYNDLRKDLVLNFFYELEERLRKKLPDGWGIVVEMEKLDRRWGHPIRIEKSDSCAILYAIEFDKGGFCGLYHGVVRRNPDKTSKQDLIKCRSNGVVESFLAEINPHDKENEYWLDWEYIYKSDILDFILEHGGEAEAARFIEVKIFEAFNKYKDLIDSCNAVLESS